MAQQILTEVDLTTARKWYNVGVKVYEYTHGEEGVVECETRADIALANYNNKVLFIETQKKK